jgi:hypothetical protein
VKITEEAIGYKKENGEYLSDLNWDMSWAGGAGSLYSTCEDLYKWNEALFNGKVLSAESLKSAFTPVLLNDGKLPVAGKYGYGWFIGDHRGQETIGHGGGLHGFSTRITRYPKENLTIVMLTNVIPTEVTLEPEVLADYFIWNKLGPQESFSTKNAVVDDVKQYEGRFDLGGMVMTFVAVDKNLFAQVSGQSQFQVYPSAPGEYFWKVVPAKVKFIKDATGAVNSAEFSQGGNTMLMQRIKDPVIVKVDPALFEYYVGKYDMGDKNVVTVTREADKLYAQSTTSPRFEVYPLSEKEFTIKELNAKLEFVREGDQKATKFILEMGGQRREMPRIE